MSVLDNMFEEEYNRLIRIRKAKYRDYISIHKGSITVKVIHGKKYYYLQWREGRKVLCQYISESSLEQMKQAIERRNQLKEAIASIDSDIKKLKRVMK